LLHLIMRIRLAREEDLPIIDEIFNQAVFMKFCTAHLEPIGMEQREKWFAVHDPERYPVYVAESGRKVTGWISLSPYRADRQALAHVAEVSYFVHEDHRGTGIGSMMLQHAINVAPAFGFSVLVAILLDRNRASMALLEKYSFERWATMPGIVRIGRHRADHLYYGLKL
jgi:L-amino acid N-acyltransferase YncA